MNSDLTFITNEKNKKLLDRFKVLIKDTQFFDVLVGYFFTSGFHALYKSLEKTKKIRILIGIGTNRQIVDITQESKNLKQSALQFSSAEIKEQFSKETIEEMSSSEDSQKVDEGVAKFLEWLKKGKMEVKAYPTSNIHAKLYIMTFAKGDRDVGRVITGSSNFTKAGLIDNLEFNMELKNRADYDFSLQKFNELWENAVDVSDKYIETIKTKTWLNNTITPYELYLKFLYDYFKEELKHEKAQKDYYQFRLEQIKELPKPIPSRRWRRIIHIPTTYQKLFTAEEINDLYDTSPLEDKMHQEMKRRKIEAERQVYVRAGGQNYCLDFGIFCRKGNIDVECDGEKYHTLPDALAKDRQRNNNLVSFGWRVLRFSGKEIYHVLQDCLGTVERTINNLGGLNL